MLLRVEMVWWWLVLLLAVGVLAIDYEEKEEEGEEPYIELVEVWGSMVVKAGVPQLSSIPLSICRTYSIRKKNCARNKNRATLHRHISLVPRNI